MTKLLWVLLPLLLAGATLALLALRGRMPSRLALNVWSSLFLLVYVLGTAGLGIFWVANQHLPVFDWHYLFGYATVLLLVLHLAFNFRVVWQHLARRRPSAPREGRAPAAPAGLGRRPALGALGVLGATALAGGAFVLGLRHGRTELRIEPATGPAAGAGVGTAVDNVATALALVEQFHEFSAHSRAGLLRRAPGVAWGDPPPPFKPYPIRPGAARLVLPSPQVAREARDGRPFDAVALGAVLWHTAGVSQQSGTIAFRTSPSSGALFSTELYVVVRAVTGVESGVWHYDARTHALQRLPGRLPTELAMGLEAGAAPADTLAVVVATAIFRRSGHKYRDRTYRYVLADLGHALENLQVAAQALGAATTLQRRFDEARTAALLVVDEAEEGVLALAVLRPAGRAPIGQAGPLATAASTPVHAASATPSLLARAPNGDATHWQAPVLSTAGAAPLGVTDAMHRATSLRVVASSPAVVPMVPLVPDPGAANTLPLPLPMAAPADPLKVIAQRRSVRRFAQTPLPLPALSAILAAMARTAPQLSDAVRIDVVTQAVQGLETASWRYDPVAHRLRMRVRHDGGLRRRSRAAALGQDVIGDAAAVLVLSMARAAFAADPSGPARGYRHAFLEAGLVGERLYLEAGARGLGVCAVGAFYDDEATALVGVDPQHEWIVHFAALGIPA